MARTTGFRKANQVQVPAGPLTIPYRFHHRSYQARLLDAFMPDPATGRAKYQRGCWVAHRGSGKDFVSVAGILIPHMLFNPGTYWHVFPKFTQGKKAIWQPQEHMTYTDLFPPHLLMRKNDTECLIELRSNVADPVTGQPRSSIYQIVGGDTLSEHLVGAGPKGVVYSEWPIMDPSAYDFIAPRLQANGGWALFIFTPRGRNHGWQTWQTAQANPEVWFSELLTVAQTKKDARGENGDWVISPEKIEAERKEGRAEAFIQQDYFCSFSGFLKDTIFGDLVTQARERGYIAPVVRDANAPVGACLDIGRSDGTAVWFFQTHGLEIRLIDYYSCRLKGADHVIPAMQAKPYVYGRIVLPNDAQIKGFSAAVSTYELFQRRFRCPVILLDKVASVQAGIDATRLLFPRMLFDQATCSAKQADGMPSGLESLEGYHRTWDDDRMDYSGPPVHDQYSHGADALRHGALQGFTPLDPLERPTWTHAEMAFDLWHHDRPAQRTERDPELAFNLFAMR